MPWRPLGLRRFYVAGVGQCALLRGRMYALASLGFRDFCMPTWGNVHCQDLRPGVPWSPPRLRDRHGIILRDRHGIICAAKGSHVRPGVPWYPPRLHGRRGTISIAKGSDIRPGVTWFPPRLRGRCGTMCTAKGSDVRPGVLWSVSASFAW